ncbi:MAG: bifunctional riboflavin kinase/FAD synthetase [Chitinophagaceae bacterium]|nr:bifunctional riboflavin kinase/FAD synthetase [Chitinophagaceae bacterium]
MTVHKDIERLQEFKNAVVTIGTFDGVHTGHQEIISRLKTEAKRINGETVIITFHPHPRKVVYHETKKIELINTIDERIGLLAEKGIDHLVIVPFTEKFSALSPNQYVEDFLKAKFNPAVVIIGYDHKFGKERKGDYKLLEEYCHKGFFELKEIPQHLLNNITVSSTMIRESLKQGDIDKVNQLLGYKFFFEGKVVKGDQRGRTIGFPTANIELTNPEKIIPGNGVYIVELEISGMNKRFRGMMNIGVRPTVDGSRKTIEVNILDFNEDIYGRTVTVYLEKYLRPEMKFAGLDALKAQLEKDRQDSVNYFNHKFLH